MNSIKSLLQKAKPAVIGMIHVKPLPGTPLCNESVQQLVSNAIKEAKIYSDAGVDAVMVENMWDLPYIRSEEMGPEIVAVMTRICRAVREVIPASQPCGIQILAGGGEESLAVSLAADLQFVRSEAFVFGHLADEGWMDACAGPLLRYRKKIGAENVAVFTDIKKKHSAHSVTSDVSIVDNAKAAEFFLSDGVILTGSSTGVAASAVELKDVKDNVAIPVLIGSGVTVDNVTDFTKADGLIIGSHFKQNERWTGKLDSAKVKAFMAKIKTL